MPTFFITPEKGVKHQVLAGVGASEFRKFRRLRILGLGASAGGVLSSGWCVCVCVRLLFLRLPIDCNHFVEL